MPPEDCVKTNITLKLDTDLLQEVKVLAARRGTSISRLMTDQIEELVQGEKAFDEAKRRALTRLDKDLDLGWTKPSREDLYER
jgi:predicted transcriptional regulator